MTGRLGLRAVAVALVVATGGMLPACAKKPSIVPTGILEADKFLYQRGQEMLGKKRWAPAREYFRKIVDDYPQSTYRPDAKLGLGDAYLGEDTAESLVYAQNEFKEFLTFFPTHNRADYAQYRLALTHFNQMASADRDQLETRQALVEFGVFAARFPNSPLLDQARAKIRATRDRLSLSDYKVGFFYWRVKWYPGAIERFKAVVNSDPEYPLRDMVYFHLADSFVKVGNKAAALPYYDRLIQEFEKSQYLAPAKAAAAKIKAEMAKAMK